MLPLLQSGADEEAGPGPWMELLVLQPVAAFQLAAFPFAFLYSRLCSVGYLSVNARYLILLVGGVILLVAALGPYSLLVLTPAFLSAFLLPVSSPESVHIWAFPLQMAWQTLCHFWLQYTSSSLQDIPNTRAISSLMLLTQRVTSLALDIHEGKLKHAFKKQQHGCSQRPWLKVLPLSSYMIFFPALLGGPLCSFETFEKQIKGLITPPASNPIKVFTWMCLRVLVLQLLGAFVGGCAGRLIDFTQCSQFDCVWHMWITALLFKLTYYSHWLLDESLLHAAGFGLQLNDKDRSFQRDLSDMDLWTLETTNRMSLFTRTWNRSTSQWMKRLIFQRCSTQPVLMTFVFSVWWHGLYPGQVFGFLCWAVMVEIDYQTHPYFSSVVKSRYARLLYRVCSRVQTQLLVAYIMMSVEMRAMGPLWDLCMSYCSLFPLLNCVLLLFVKIANK